MDWLVKYVTGRNVALLLLLAAFLQAAAVYYTYPVYWFKRWLYPPQGPTPAAGSDILADTEKREAARVEARYRRVLAELDESAAEGFEVANLKRTARAALRLNVQAYRRRAVAILAEVEMAVPRRRAPDIPLGPTAAPGDDATPEAQARPAAPARARAKRRRS